MALERFSNIEEINEVKGKLQGIYWKAEDVDQLKLDMSEVKPEKRPVVEIQLYTIDGTNTYVGGGVIDDFEILKDKIYINYGKACQSIGVERGRFEVVVNIYKNLLGSEDSPDLYLKGISPDRRELWIQADPEADLDVDRYLEGVEDGETTEVLFQHDKHGNIVKDKEDNPQIEATTIEPLSEDIFLNFGENKLYKIINQKEWNAEDDFVARMYKEMPADINVKDKCWVVELLADSYVDNIILEGPGATDQELNKLLGPNFDIDPIGGTVSETDFKNWNDLLDAGVSTSQQIVDRIFSGSLGTNLKIDYSGFQNFIHFSSAEERVNNFIYKLQKLEFYDARLATLNSATADAGGGVADNIQTTTKRKDALIGTFDGFERWLYYEPTSSIFTHHESVYNDNNNKVGVYRADGGFIGAAPYRIPSYPKYIEDGNYVLHPTTHHLVTSWSAGVLATASLYDSENNESLAKTIPEHIRLDESNDQYTVFVNMIGQHFDILYSYIDNLTRVYKPEEHPKLGQNKDVIYQVAQSLGWKLQNGNQAEALWKYKLGLDTGSVYQSTGSLFTKSNEDITTEVWRRIVNNLPFLLKTKGTARSIKALMNTYGIPQTLLSIREYGGPKVEEETPLLIEDRFNYALEFNKNGNSIQYARTFNSASITISNNPTRTWGVTTEDNFTIDLTGTGLTNDQVLARPADTIELRFRPARTGSSAKEILLSNVHSTLNEGYWNLGFEGSPTSISGSDKYARLYFEMQTGFETGETGGARVNANRGGGGGGVPTGGDSTNGIVKVTTAYLPLFDGNFWNMRLYTEFPFVTGSVAESTPRIFIECQQASDYITDKIIHRASASLWPGTASNAEHGTALNRWTFANHPDSGSRIVIGGKPSSVSSTNVFRGIKTTSQTTQIRFSGSMQEYREWMEVLDEETFGLHTTNPTSYVSRLSPTSSFDTLIRHYPFGTDLNAIDISVGGTGGNFFITSSHPNRSILDFSEPFNQTNINSSFARASGFAGPVNNQRGNFVPVEETYYIQGISLGATLPKSQKIRFDDNQLVRRLKPTNTSERSRFDFASLDSNRLGLFYSAADQINKDIFNHVGDVELDDFVGDPFDEFKVEYPDLSNFSNEYWKKYSDRNDLNAFIKIFSQFDFSLFEQMKQLIPERVDEAMGVLVEPHALERSKYHLTKRPVKEPLHYDGSLHYAITQSGETIPLEATVDRPVGTSGESIYHVGTGGQDDAGNYLAHIPNVLPGEDPYDQIDYCTKTIFPVDARPSITSSFIGVYQTEDVEDGFITQASNLFKFTTKTQAFALLGGSPQITGSFTDPEIGDFILFQEGSLQQDKASRKLRAAYETYLRYDSIQDIRVEIQHNEINNAATTGSLFVRLIETEAGNTMKDFPHNTKMGNPGTVDVAEVSSTLSRFKQLSETQRKTIFGNNLQPDTITEFTFNDVKVPARSRLQVEFWFNNGVAQSMRPMVMDVRMFQTINKACHNPEQIVVLDPRPSRIFKQQVLHYTQNPATEGKSKFDRNQLAYLSASLGKVRGVPVPSKFNHSSSFSDTQYRDDFFAQTENLYVEGCKLTAPGMNISSDISAIDQRPVIEIFETNPNTLIFNPEPSDQNPGFLEVR